MFILLSYNIFLKLDRGWWESGLGLMVKIILFFLSLRFLPFSWLLRVIDSISFFYSGVKRFVYISAADFGVVNYLLQGYYEGKVLLYHNLNYQYLNIHQTWEHENVIKLTLDQFIGKVWIISPFFCSNEYPPNSLSIRKSGTLSIWKNSYWLKTPIENCNMISK